MQKGQKTKKVKPEQEQPKPGLESKMKPKPVSDDSHYKGSGKLKNKVALVTGGDSGIGRAVCIAFAKEGARIAISYLNEHSDAKETKRLAEKYGAECIIIPGDLGEEKNCVSLVKKVIKAFGQLDILVNNAATHYPQDSLEKITAEQLQETFRTNVYSYFFTTREALKHLKKGSCIINTSSVTAYRGSGHLIDYSATKGAIVTFTRSLSASLATKGIRVNGVAPGPIWTPLIVSSMDKEKVSKFGSDTPLGRPGEPEELAPSYVFLASDDSSYMTGQFLHPNGGEIVNG